MSLKLQKRVLPPPSSAEELSAKVQLIETPPVTEEPTLKEIQVSKVEQPQVEDLADFIEQLAKAELDSAISTVKTTVSMKVSPEDKVKLELLAAIKNKTMVNVLNEMVVKELEAAANRIPADANIEQKKNLAKIKLLLK